MPIEELDHVVVNVADGERALAWYCDVLGLEPLRADEWRAGRAPFPSVRVTDGTIVDLFVTARTGENVNHLCFVMDAPGLHALAASGALDVIEGPVRRWGARGDGCSYYVRDPDGNTIELRHYGAEPD